MEFIGVMVSVLTLMMALGLKVLFDIRGELSQVSATQAEQSKRLDSHDRRLERNEQRWEELPHEMKADRHELRNWVTMQLGELENAIREVAVGRRPKEGR